MALTFLIQHLRNVAPTVIGYLTKQEHLVRQCENYRGAKVDEKERSTELRAPLPVSCPPKTLPGIQQELLSPPPNATDIGKHLAEPPVLDTSTKHN